jgi:hypothetical protein
MKFAILILAALSLTACEVNDAMHSANSIPPKMDKMNQRLDETSEAIRLQKLAIAKENLEDEKNSYVLMPIPTGLIGYAKLFAETATVDELVGQIYLYIKEVNDGMPIPTDAADHSLDQNIHRLQRMTAAQAIAAFVPKETIAKMVDQEIVQRGRYQKTAMNILTMRFQFLRDVMLSASLLAEPFASVGSAEDALKYLGYMDDILSFSFKDEIMVKITGFTPPFQNNEEWVKDQGAAQLSELVGHTKNLAMELAKVTPTDLTGDPQRDKLLAEDNSRRLTSALSELDRLQGRWTK